MTSYTNVFGGNNINTAFPSYMSYTFSENINLTWATSFVDNTNVTAQINDLNATQVDLIVKLANATFISVGQQVQFNNVGTNPVTINDNSGNELAIIPPTDNNQYIFYLKDNSTIGGTWGITHLGAGTSSADASILSGLGLIPLNGLLNTNFPGKTIGANYQVLLSDRASIIVWTGGSGAITLPAQLAGFYIAVNNEGTGSVTINTPDATTIDGEPSFTINPGESSYFIGVVNNWNSLGYGVETFFSVNILAPLDISTSSTTVLTNQQASKLVQQFIGVLTENVTVEYPAAAGQWYVWNNTTGAYTVTLKLNGVGVGVVIPQGEKIIIYSDSTEIYNTPTVSTSTVFSDGSVGSPGIAFTAQNTTGFYRIGSGNVGYSSAGTQSLGFDSSGLYLPGTATYYYNNTNGNHVGFQAGITTASVLWTLPLADAAVSGQALTSNAAGTLSWQTLNVGAGGTGNTTFTAYSVLCGGTTSTGSFQNVSGLGTSGQALLSSGASALPTWGTPLFPNNITGFNCGIAFASSQNSGIRYRSPFLDFFHNNVNIFSISSSLSSLNIFSANSLYFWNLGTTNYVGFKGGASTTNTVWTLPLVDATVSGQALTSNAGGTLSWQTVGGALRDVSDIGEAGQVLISNGKDSPPTWNSMEVILKSSIEEIFKSLSDKEQDNYIINVSVKKINPNLSTHMVNQYG